MTTSHSTPARLALPALMIAAFAVTGCSASSGNDSASTERAPASAADVGAGEAPGSRSADDSASADQDSEAETPGRVAPALQAQTRREVIRTGVVSLVSDEATDSRAEVQKIVDVNKGLVTDEETSTDDEGEIDRSRLVVRVPAASFSDTMDALEHVAELESSDTSSEDVTAQVVDVDARIKAQEIGLRRIESLLDQASSMERILQIESEITSRQAELDSMRSQRASLADQTAMSTITVHLAQRHRSAAPPEKAEEKGFTAGLAGGWDALSATLLVLATVAGALLPWGVLLAVVGVPAWLLLRRFAVRRAPAEPAAPPQS